MYDNYKFGRQRDVKTNQDTPIGKQNRKKQVREVNTKARSNGKFKSNSNKNSNRHIKKHTPANPHKKY